MAGLHYLDPQKIRSELFSLRNALDRFGADEYGASDEAIAYETLWAVLRKGWKRVHALFPDNFDIDLAEGVPNGPLHHLNGFLFNLQEEWDFEHSDPFGDPKLCSPPWPFYTLDEEKIVDSASYAKYIRGAVHAIIEAFDRATDSEGTADPAAEEARHSPDFRSVNWFGTPYTFTRTQAACVKVLWAAWEAATPELDGLTVVTQADVSQTRLSDVFKAKGKMHLAWGTMIAQGQSKGAYRLSEPATVAKSAVKLRGKESRKSPRKSPR